MPLSDSIAELYREKSAERARTQQTSHSEKIASNVIVFDANYIQVSCAAYWDLDLLAVEVSVEQVRTTSHLRGKNASP